MNTDKLRSFSASVFICVHRWFKIEGHLSVATTVGQAVPDMGNRKALSVRHSLTYFNCQKGADDPEILHAMVEANVPADPYWWSPSNQHKQPTSKLVICPRDIDG